MEMGLFGTKKNTSAIRKVRLMGMRTASETLIFTTVNFSVYSFWVEYENGTSETIEVAPENPNDKSGKEKKLFNKLMTYANVDSIEHTETPPDMDSASILDELKKLKDLLDAEVIPQDLYEKRRTELLKLMSSTGDISKHTQKNVKIIRANKHPWGEGDTSTYVDGQELNVNLDDSISLFLSDGEYTIYFQRGSIRSKKIKFVIAASKGYQISVTPKTFSINVSVEEKAATI